MRRGNSATMAAGCDPSRRLILLPGMPFYVLKNESVEGELRRIAHEQIGIVLSDFSDDAVSLQERVHSLRSRCKKMRSLLRLIRPLLGEAFDAEDREFRAAGKLLGQYRDNDVLAKTIESLGWCNAAAYVSPTQIPPATIDRSLEIMSERLEAVDSWRFDIRGFEDLVPGLSRTYQNCLDAWDTVQQKPYDANFHLLRKRTKYHWYQVCILERLNMEEVRERREMLDDLQMTLGKAHDLAMLQAFLESGDHLEMELLQQAITRKRELYGHAIKLGEEVYAAPVDELIRRFSRGWAMRRGAVAATDRPQSRH